MFAADARKHTPGKNAEKENFSMRILVCDDDAAFAGQLAEKIEAIVKPQMPRSTVDCATDAAQLRALPLAKYDLAFLDIDMGSLNGVDLARRLHELHPDMLLIFVTNYVEYSLQGYEVQAFRYLLKAEMPQKLERYVQQALTAYRKTRDTVRIFCDGEDAELAARLTSYLTRVVYNQRANYIRALMKIKEHECSIEDCDSDIESQSMRSGNSLEESIESKLMWEAIRKYLPKLELKECEVMIALYIDRLSVTATAAKLRVDASTVRRRRDSACDKIRKAMEEK